ncbi:hypothetical protein C7S18_11255 [Ahniella affigens]|uniref:HAMP domain-containing protein n=1 Tax=Ahniella affigens TaxID=2021234 RepID=A0A2P1PSD0_9GAMM|nr:histidine kinase [Ahniella affigens]AVP97741.1 hypothetical protein C7S18_11255 [Ahniella affigens]
MPKQLGLLPKLAFFFLLLALPALLLLDFVRASIEFNALTRTLESDQLRREIQREQAAMARHLTERELVGLGTTRDLERWVLRLAQRSHKVLGDHALTLAEQRRQPIRAFLVDDHGQIVVDSHTGGFNKQAHDWLLSEAPRDDPTLRWRRQGSLFTYLHPLEGIPDRSLVLQFELATPAQNFLNRARIEWPIMLLDGLLLALASAFFLRAWVIARLARMRAAALEWRQGNLQTRINDPNRDEIGLISEELDRVPVALDALMQANAALIGADERARLARDLHDTVKQKAFGLAMQLAAVEGNPDPAARSNLLKECRTLVADIQRSLVEIIDDLKPVAGVPFAVRLQNDIEAWSRRSGIAVFIDLSGADSVALTDQANLNAILSEALANVHRHSQARRVDITLIRQRNELQFSIVDDGLGGARASAGRGIGHLNSRAAELPNGHCRIDSDARGTRIDIRWTLRQETKTP